MKIFLRPMALIIALCGLTACNDNDKDLINITEYVTYNDIYGTWKLTQWNGETMNDGRYFYVTFDRKDRVFDIYQNINTNKTRHITGRYLLNDIDNLGTIIEGDYHHASGFWGQNYLIAPYSKDEMTWVVVTREFDLPVNPWTPDFSDVSVYTRVDSVPAEVLNNTRVSL